MGKMPMPPQFQPGLERPGDGQLAANAAKKKRNRVRFVRKASEPPGLPTAAWTNATKPRVNVSADTAAGATLNATGWCLKTVDTFRITPILTLSYINPVQISN